MFVKNHWTRFASEFSVNFERFIQQLYILVNIVIGFNFAVFYYFYDQNRLFLNKQISKNTELISKLKVPVFLRHLFYKAFGKFYNINFQQIKQPISSFETFSDFFCREVHPRDIPSSDRQVVSPADSKILAIEEISQDKCSIIKDIKYSLCEIMTGQNRSYTKQEIEQLKHDPQHGLYQVIFYLSPGDYHRYHCPVDMTVESQTEYHGNYYPVHEKGLRKFKKTYEKNEKVKLQGKYRHGFINMILVGAFNVGNIVVRDEKSFKKGEEVGMFKLGSTVVLIFEAPKTIEWKIKQGEKVKYGDVICDF